MATYNGEQFIEKQVLSILSQLSKIDELIIVDDCSSDNTINILKDINDSRIKIHKNHENMGHVLSFCKSVSFAKNKYIFLSDQDDIWIDGRVNLMIQNIVEDDSILLTSNFKWIDENDNPIEVLYDGVDQKDSKKYLKNVLDIFIGKTNYFGCAMVFKQELTSVISPTPKFVESHDLWVALAANILKSNRHINAKTFLKRRHSSNATSTHSSRPVWKKLYSRIIFLLSIFVIYKRKLIN